MAFYCNWYNNSSEKDNVIKKIQSKYTNKRGKKEKGVARDNEDERFVKAEVRGERERLLFTD